MKNLLFLFFLFTVIVKAQPIINGPSPINICDDNNTGFAVFNLETKNAEILGTLNPNEYAVSYHITLQNANQNSNPLPLVFTNTVYSYQVIFVRVQENADPTNFATTVLYLDVVELPPFPAIIPNITLYENPYDGSAVFNFTVQTTLLLNGLDNVITYHTSLVDAQNGSNSIPNPNAFTGTNLQTIWARNQNTPTSCFNITSFHLKIFDSNLLVLFTDAKFKARLIQQGKDFNNDGEIQITEALQLTTLNVDGGNFSFANKISSLAGIEYFTNLTSLTCSNNILTTLNLQALTNLTTLNCSYNAITTLNSTGLTDLITLNCSGNQLSALNLQQHTNLQSLNCPQNQLTTLNVQGLNDLQTLNCEQNQLTSINVQGLTNLQTISCNNNLLTGLNLNGLSNLQYLYCYNNQLTTINVDGLNNLGIIHCQNNQLSNLNFENLPNLVGLYCSWNPLYTLNIKNGINMYDFQVINTGLIHICVDDSELDFIVSSLGTTNPNCQVNSYCNFVPGGDYNTIEGINKFDANQNGCDALDFSLPGLKFNISGDSNSGTFIYNTSGGYSIPVQAGNHTVTPLLENPSYFTINPISLVASFPTQASPLIQDFCIAPNGIHHDVEMVFIPTSTARPGFNATYAIVYKNKGNQVESGTITLNFNDAVLNFITSNIPSISQSLNTLAWDYSNLLPFESRSINLVFSVNSPMDIPEVTIGDQLDYSATITTLTTDEFVADNTSILNQIVVGSYDPNDKTCIEGTTVSPNMIGQYVHYVIRFENTGTFPAENIVVKDMIDLVKFDINTLIPLHSSHNFVTRINGNKVEFIFEGINLPFNDATNDGYIAFKIKTKSTLVLGDTFTNSASIYFDYNFPIITNTTTTTVAALNVQDFDFNNYFTLYPNPAKEVLNVQTKGEIGVKSVTIYNMLGQMVLAYTNSESLSALDVSQLKTGTYFIKLATDKGTTSQKFIKEQ